MATTSQANSSRCAIEKRREIRAADFLLALDQHDEIHRQIALLLHRLLDAEDVREDLPLVIARAARGDDAVLDAGIERRTMPQIERVDRLHIIVAVKQDGRASLLIRGPRATMIGCPGVSCCTASRPMAVSLVFSQSAQAEDLVFIIGVRGDAAEAEEIDELVESDVCGHGVKGRAEL